MTEASDKQPMERIYVARIRMAQRIKDLEAKLAEVTAKNEKLETLFDMEWERDKQAMKRWQADDPEARALILPDRGVLLDWLWNKLQAQEQELTTLRELCSIAAEYVDGRLGQDWLARYRALTEADLAHAVASALNRKGVEDALAEALNDMVEGVSAMVRESGAYGWTRSLGQARAALALYEGAKDDQRG